MMIRTHTNLMRRFADVRPGLNLLAVEDAALPVSVLRTDVLLQEAKDIPATDEFFLRFVEEGVDSIDEVAGYLGLPRELVLDAAARQTSMGHVTRKDSSHFALTELGRIATKELVASQPALKQISFVFDRFSWRPASYPIASLLRRSAASQSGMLLLPASSTAAISSRDIAVSDLNQIMPGRRANVLRVNRLAGRRHLWAPAQVLVFGDSASRELELAVYIDDEIAQTHEEALQETDAVAHLQLSVAPPPFIPTPRFGISNSDPQAEQEDVFSIEHLDHLLQALTRAKKRLVVASQSASDSTVTESLVTYLRDRARAGVSVTIILDEHAPDDDSARARLETLSKREANMKLTRAELSGTSTLVYDDVVIETSFDWLSGGKNGREYSWSAGRLTRSEHNAKATAAKHGSP